MPALNFPDNPTPGQTYSFGVQSWTWDGETWNVTVPSALEGRVSLAESNIDTLEANDVTLYSSIMATNASVAARGASLVATNASLAVTAASVSAIEKRALGVVAVGALNGAYVDLAQGTSYGRITPDLVFKSTIGRRYRITLRVRAMLSLGGAVQSGVMALYDGNTIHMSDWHYDLAASGYGNTAPEFLFDGDGVTRAYNFRCSNGTIGGAGGTRYYLEGPSVGSGAAFYIEDVGPSGAAPMPPGVSYAGYGLPYYASLSGLTTNNPSPFEGQMALVLLTGGGKTTVIYRDGKWWALDGPLQTGFTTPLLGSTSNPNLGSTGSQSGQWQYSGGCVEWSHSWSFGGTGITAGSGYYQAAPPIQLLAVANTSRGALEVLDNGTAWYDGNCFFVGTNTVRWRIGGAGDMQNNAAFSPGSATPAAGDAINLTIRYPAVSLT